LYRDHTGIDDMHRKQINRPVLIGLKPYAADIDHK